MICLIQCPEIAELPCKNKK